MKVVLKNLSYNSYNNNNFLFVTSDKIYIFIYKNVFVLKK